MYAIYAEQTSCSGDTHNFIIAAFTTKEKAEVFLPKIQTFWPKECFVILEYVPPIIDPKNIEDVIEDEVNESETPRINESETIRNDNSDLRRLLEL